MKHLGKILLGALAIGGIVMIAGGSEDVVESGQYQNVGDNSKKARWKVVAEKDGSLTGYVKIPGSRGGNWQSVVETSADGLESAKATIHDYLVARAYEPEPDTSEGSGGGGPTLTRGL